MRRIEDTSLCRDVEGLWRATRSRPSPPTPFPTTSYADITGSFGQSPYHTKEQNVRLHTGYLTAACSCSFGMLWADTPSRLYSH